MLETLQSLEWERNIKAVSDVDRKDVRCKVSFSWSIGRWLVKDSDVPLNERPMASRLTTAVEERWTRVTLEPLVAKS